MVGRWLCALLRSSLATRSLDGILRRTRILLISRDFFPDVRRTLSQCLRRFFLRPLVPYIEPVIGLGILLEKAPGWILASHCIYDTTGKEHLLPFGQRNVQLFVGGNEHPPVRISDVIVGSSSSSAKDVVRMRLRDVL